MLSDRETAYVALYLEFWPRPFDWDAAGLESPLSSFAPVRIWLRELTQPLRLPALRRAMRALTQRHPKGPPLDPVRASYFRELAEEREERLRETLATGRCVYCDNTGAVCVATWTDRTGRTRVLPRSPRQGVPGPVREAFVACSCAAGDSQAKAGGWSPETRRKFIALRLSPSQFAALREAVASMPVVEPAEAEEDSRGNDF